MTLFSPTASFVRQCALGGAALLLSLPLGASTPSKASAPKAPQPAPPKSEETVFFTVLAGGHSVLGRCDSEGSSKAYLGPWGQGWQSFPAPALGGDDLAAAPAPDGSQFALLSSRGGSVNLWLVSADGKSASALTDDDTGILPASAAGKDSLAFSPDGKTLAYIARGDLWVMDLADRQARTLTFDGGVRALCWSPAGDALAVIQGNSLRRVAFDGSSDTLLVANRCRQPLVAWSRNPQSPDDIYFFDLGAQKVDSLTMAVDAVLPSSVEPNSLAPQPQGLALLAQALGGEAEVFLTGASGPAAGPKSGDDHPSTQVTQGGAQAVWSSPSGKSLYFLRDQVLWRCDLDGGRAKPLGAVPMSHVNVGLLAPLPGGFR